MKSSDKQTVVIGLLGSVLDAGQGANRWERWRPSIALCQHYGLLVDRFELLYDSKFARLADQIATDIALVSPETKVQPHLVAFRDPWDFQDVFGALHDFVRGYAFNTEAEDYLV